LLWKSLAHAEFLGGLVKRAQDRPHRVDLFGADVIKHAVFENFDIAAHEANAGTDNQPARGHEFHVRVHEVRA
jgi:hypothetical protein